MKKLIKILIIIFFISGCEKITFHENQESSRHIFNICWQEVDKYFSFFEYLEINWDSVYTVFDTKISDNTPDYNLFKTLSEMMFLLKDGHTGLYSNYGSANFSYYSKYRINILPDISSYFEFYSKLNNALEYGLLMNQNIGYIKIKTFSGTIETQEYEKIDFILEQLKQVKSIIIDVRSNGGGNSSNADLIAKRFNDSKRYIFSKRRRNGPNHNDFTDWHKIYLEPFEKDIYSKPVYVLTNRFSYSSTEWFVSEMNTIPQVKTVGDTTGGGSGNPLIRELPNGWVMRISNTQKQLPSGKDFQYTGISPDIPVWISKEDSINGIDKILETAINQINNI